MARADLRTQLLRGGQFDELPHPPDYMEQYSWVPTFFLRHIRTQSEVGFEVIRTTVLPKRILQEAKRAQDENPGFSVVLLVHVDASTESVVDFSRQQGFGLSVFAGAALSPLVPGRFDEAGARPIPTQKRGGWIPDAICEHAERLQRVRAAPIIRGSLDILGRHDARASLAIAAVETALEDIIADQQSRFAAALPFYRFVLLERLLRLKQPEASDHVIHSFRVYVTGCILLEHFWETCSQMWDDYLGLRDARIEDVWFLIAMFHDCGYVRLPAFRSAAADALSLSLPDPTAEEVIPAREMEAYTRAARLVGSVLSHVRRGTTTPWDFDGVGWSEDSGLQEGLLRWYTRLESHAVVGALDLAAEMIRSVRSALADGETAGQNRVFLLSHVCPAAAAIAMHDWHLWDEYRRHHLMPFRAERYPLAGMLIYLDTWDDYRRRTGDGMSVLDMHLSPTTASVTVGWNDERALAKAAVAYKNYSKFIRWPRAMRLRIAAPERTDT